MAFKRISKSEYAFIDSHRSEVNSLLYEIHKAHNQDDAISMVCRIADLTMLHWNLAKEYFKVDDADAIGGELVAIIDKHF